MCCRPFCPTVRVYDPPVTVVKDVYHPQIVEVVHRVNIVTRHHCVPVEKHIYQYCHENVDASHGDHRDDSHKSHRSHKSHKSHKSGRPYISKTQKSTKGNKK